jgi:hypothetical protein
MSKGTVHLNLDANQPFEPVSKHIDPMETGFCGSAYAKQLQIVPSKFGTGSIRKSRFEQIGAGSSGLELVRNHLLPCQVCLGSQGLAAILPQNHDAN